MVHGVVVITSRPIYPMAYSSSCRQEFEHAIENPGLEAQSSIPGTAGFFFGVFLSRRASRRYKSPSSAVISGSLAYVRTGHCGLSVQVLGCQRLPGYAIQLSSHKEILLRYFGGLKVNVGGLCQPRSTVNSRGRLVRDSTESFYSQPYFHPCCSPDLRRRTRHHPRCVKEWYIAE
jgi:hypothetical protein